MRIALLSDCEVKAGLFSCVLPLLVIWSRQLLKTYKILKLKHLIYAFYIYIIQLQKASLKFCRSLAGTLSEKILGLWEPS